MANYLIDTTQSIYTTLDIANLVPDDTITTRGYYAPDDGGGATFTVETGTADGFFSHNINGHSGKIAVMVIEDGVVNIDQLGAKGDAVLPECYNDAVSTIDLCNTRTIATLTANSGSTNNKPYFLSANNHVDVQEIRLTPGKIYGITKPVGIASNKKLNGCGATIMNLKDTRGLSPNNDIQMLCCGKGNSNTILFEENVEICNLRLIGNVYLRSNNLYGSLDAVQGIWARNVKNMRIHDVQIERCGHAIHVNLTTPALQNNDLNQVNIDHVHICDSLMGVQYNCVQNSHLTDSEISVDYTVLSSANNMLHCIYVDKRLENCTFSNLKLQNANGGNAIILKGDSPTSLCNNIRIHDCQVDAVRNFVTLYFNVKNVSINNICAQNISETSLYLADAENVKMTNCSFSGFGLYGGFQLSSNSSYARNVLIRNCTFDFLRAICYVGDTHEGTNDLIVVQDCSFKVSVLYQNWTPSFSPGYTIGLSAIIQWIGCTFEMIESPDCPDNINRMRAWNEMNGHFFFLDGGLYPDNSQYWRFDKCTFINRTNLTVNSPICCNYEQDFNGTIHCTIKNCILDGFRWTIRIAQRITNANSCEKITEDGITRYKVNPCCIGNNGSLKAVAASYLTETGRFFGKNNWYCERDLVTGNRTGYAIAEEFGS